MLVGLFYFIDSETDSLWLSCICYCGECVTQSYNERVTALTSKCVLCYTQDKKATVWSQTIKVTVPKGCNSSLLALDQPWIM